MGTLIFLGGTLLFTAGVVWQGFVLSVLWSWFVSPVFQTAHLGVPQAIGLALVVSMFQKHKTNTEKTDWRHFLAAAFVAPVFSLLFGWITKFFL